MNSRLVFPALVFCSATALAAEAFGPVATESRDASAAYILTQNFVIGRTARDCFPILERADSPKSFEAAWQQRNARYMSAAMIGKDDKQAACRKVIGLMEAGAFDIDQRSPMFGEIQALLNYAGGD